MTASVKVVVLLQAFQPDIGFGQFEAEIEAMVERVDGPDCRLGDFRADAVAFEDKELHGGFLK